MKKLLLVIASLLIVCDLSAAQSSRTQSPTINYSQYGSLSRQMTVYENVSRREAALERERYRKFREEVRRQRARDRAVLPQRTVVVRRQGCRQYECGDALRSWRERRNRR